jgi:ClpP class serine protease
VEKVAQGRVWSGRAAKAAKLVDEVGGFRDALTKAKVLAGLDPAQRVTVEVYPERPSIFKTIGKRVIMYADPVGALKKGLKDGSRTDAELELPYEMEIK